MHSTPVLAWHVMSRLFTGEVIVRPGQERQAATVILDIGRGYDLLVANAADTHIHTLVGCDRRRAGRFARAIEAALTRRMGLTGFAPVHIKPVASQSHLASAVPYILRQAERHGLAAHSYELSTATDLLGARERGNYTRAAVRARLPRLRRADLLELVGVKELQPGTDTRRLREAALRAACSAPGAPHRDFHRARAAACRLGLELGASQAELAVQLELDRTSIWRAVRRGPDEPFDRAVGLQLSLLEQLEPLASPSRSA